MKLNKKAEAEKVVNFEGEVNYKQDAKTELMTRVLCSLVGENKFYQSGEDSDNELIGLLRNVADKDYVFCLKLAAYARNEMYLRSIPQVVLVEMANHPGRFNNFGVIEFYAQKIIKRADEITEVMAYQLDKFGKPIPNCLKKAVAQSFKRFSTYQIAKYNRDGKVKMRDAMFLTHPCPIDDEQKRVFKALADQTLEPPETWEVVISGKGSTKENWQSIIPKMGIFALVRNLRNFLEKDVEIGYVLEKLRDRETILNSKMFPFRFLSAYRMIQGIGGSKTNSVLDALSDAIDISADNVPVLDGYTCVAVDNSSSMNSPISDRSIIRINDIAGCLASIVNKASNSLMVIFSGEATAFSFGKRNSILENTDKIVKACNQGCTNAHKVPVLLRDNNIKVDRIILLSDMQCWDSNDGCWGCDSKTFRNEFNSYRKKVNPKAMLYSIDLMGYGRGGVVSQGNTVTMAGWNEKVFSFIDGWEKDKQTQVKEIENYK